MHGTIIAVKSLYVKTKSGPTEAGPPRRRMPPGGDWLWLGRSLAGSGALDGLFHLDFGEDHTSAGCF